MVREVLNYLQFYNQFGREIYKTARLKGEDYQEFVLRGLSGDCNVVVKSTNGDYISGSGQSHVWIAESNSGKRVLIIHF